MRKFLIWAWAVIGTWGISFGQNATDCLNAIPVCQNIYTLAAPQGNGSQPNEINPSISCINGENNSTWFLITPQTTGALSFVITPNDPSEDFNWSVFNITTTTCADIATNANLQLICNNSNDLVGAFFDAYGQTGAHTDQPWYGGIFNFYPSFTADITVQAGQIYALYVGNTSPPNGGNGFSINFSNSSAVLFNNLPPALDSVGVPACGTTTITAHFNKPLLCQSVNPSDFSLHFGSVALNPTGVQSVHCTGGSLVEASNVYTLTFATPLLPGSYTFLIQDTIFDFCGNFIESASYNFNVPFPTVEAGASLVRCSTNSLNVNIGMAGFYPNQSFQWSSIPSNWVNSLSSTTLPLVNLTIPNLPLDTIAFILTTTTGAGCIASDTLYLYTFDCCQNFQATISSKTNIGCYNTATGMATVGTTGSLAPNFTYLWNTNPPQYLATATGLAANTTYIVTVTDGNQCKDTAQVFLSQPAAPVSFQIAGGFVTCFGGSNGSINLNVSGGTAPYNFTWNNGVPPVEDPTGLAAGTYQVTIADVNNCTITAQTTVGQPTSPLTATATGSTIPCGVATGNIQLTVSGGGSPYTYNWDHGIGNIKNPSGLIPGVYHVTVTDIYGCQIITSASVQTSVGIFATAIANDASCISLANGSVALAVVGGQPPYSFQWDNGAGTAQNPTNLLPNSYFVTVTDANGCMTSAGATVGYNSDLTVALIATPVNCFGASNGTIQLTATGSNTPFSYQWSNGLGAAQNPTNLAAGTYSVTVTDAAGCIITNAATITQPPALAVSASANHPTCAGLSNGSINLTISGGTPNYTYQWSGGLPNVQNPTNLAAGTYSVTVTDTKGCKTTTNRTLTAPPPLTASANTSPVTCNGLSNGSISLTVSGGTPNYTYQWSGGLPNVQNPTNIAAGTYSVTITDFKGCHITRTATVSQPPILTASASANHVTCFGLNNGGINLTVSGGTPNYTYQWSGGLPNVQNPTNLAAGTYNVTVTDTKGCKTTTSAALTQPALLTVSASANPPTCTGLANGNINLTVSGGTPNYTYQWSSGLGTVQNPTNLTAGTYSVTVTDTKGCKANTSTTLTAPLPLAASANATSATCNGLNNGSINLNVTGGTPNYSYQWSGGLPNVQDPTNVPAGNYTVTISDANGCAIVRTATVNQPNSLTVSANATPVTCNGLTNGSINLNISGGTPSYTFQWSGNLGTVQNPTNLGVGSYAVTVTDANNCTATASTTIGQPALLTVSASANDPTCASTSNGNINLSVMGGTPNYTYQWSGGLNPIQNPTNVAAGTYSVTITDANNCIATSSITLTSPPVFSASATTTPVTCNGMSNGSINLNVTGGTPNYVYQWSSGLNPIQNPINIAAGVYSVTITDANGCVINQSVTVSQPSAIQLSLATNPPACGQNGSIVVTPSGGILPYHFNWSSNANTGNSNVSNNLQGGTYFVTITDANNCTIVSNPIIFNSTSNLQVTASVIQPYCAAQSGVIALATTSGVPPFVYQWSSNANSGNTNVATGLNGGNYSVTVTDANNCDTVLTFNLQNPNLLSGVYNTTPAHCGSTNGSISYMITSGLPPFSFEWSGLSDTTAQVTNLLAGNYTLTVTDGNNCTLTEIISVSGSPSLIVQDSVIQPTCTQNGSIFLNITSGTSPYTYAWSPNISNTAQALNIAGGTYSVIVTDAENCTATLSVDLPIIQDFEIELLEIIDNTCFDGNEGSISIQTTSPNAVQLQWSNGDTSAFINGLGEGIYTLTATDLQTGCIITDDFEIQSPEPFVIELPSDFTVSAGDPITVAVQNPIPQATYTWLASDGQTFDGSSFTTTLFETTTYTVTGILNNCPPGTNALTLTVGDFSAIAIPDAFSPNNDGKNDLFRIFTQIPVEITEFKVFNRWGEVIYDSPDGAWDGTHRGQKVSNGSYVYLIRLITPDGKERLFNGDVLLIR